MINFLKCRYICFLLSGLFLSFGLCVYIYRVINGKPGFQYHIDFIGGTEFTVAFEKPMKIDLLRKISEETGWKDLTIQSIGFADETGSFKEFLIRITQTDEGLDVRYKKDINTKIKDNNMIIRGVSRVGAEVGRNIQWNSIVAVILSLLIILIYIAIRSKYRFAVGAVVAIVHDMLVALIVFLLLQEQISVHVHAAILAILGYSLNDTIVIFSRIRENFKKMQGRSEIDVVNISLNQTLRRTVYTSITTLFVIFSIFFLGGQTLHGFSLAMLVGVFVGTYSSIYIASPVMLAIGAEKRIGR